MNEIHLFVTVFSAFASYICHRWHSFCMSVSRQSLLCFLSSLDDSKYSYGYFRLACCCSCCCRVVHNEQNWDYCLHGTHRISCRPRRTDACLSIQANDEHGINGTNRKNPPYFVLISGHRSNILIQVACSFYV